MYYTERSSLVILKQMCGNFDCNQAHKLQVFADDIGWGVMSYRSYRQIISRQLALEASPGTLADKSSARN